MPDASGPALFTVNVTAAPLSVTMPYKERVIDSLDEVTVEALAVRSVNTIIRREDGTLLGATTDEAFFVRCDRSTMTQNDLDNGRLICLIGVAILKPAEFVIFRIGQKTAEAAS